MYQINIENLKKSLFIKIDYKQNSPKILLGARWQMIFEGIHLPSDNRKFVITIFAIQ